MDDAKEQCDRSTRIPFWVYEKKEDYMQMNHLDEVLIEDMEIPPKLLSNLINWMRKKGISDADILDCIQTICITNKTDK